MEFHYHWNVQARYTLCSPNCLSSFHKNCSLVMWETVLRNSYLLPIYFFRISEKCSFSLCFCLMLTTLCTFVSPSLEKYKFQLSETYKISFFLKSHKLNISYFVGQRFWRLEVFMFSMYSDISLFLFSGQRELRHNSLTTSVYFISNSEAYPLSAVSGGASVFSNETVVSKLISAYGKRWDITSPSKLCVFFVLNYQKQTCIFIFSVLWHVLIKVSIVSANK